MKKIRSEFIYLQLQSIQIHLIMKNVLMDINVIIMITIFKILNHLENNFYIFLFFRKLQLN